MKGKQKKKKRLYTVAVQEKERRRSGEEAEESDWPLQKRSKQNRKESQPPYWVQRRERERKTFNCCCCCCCCMHELRGEAVVDNIKLSQWSFILFPILIRFSPPSQLAARSSAFFVNVCWDVKKQSSFCLQSMHVYEYVPPTRSNKLEKKQDSADFGVNFAYCYIFPKIHTQPVQLGGARSINSQVGL